MAWLNQKLGYVKKTIKHNLLTMLHYKPLSDIKFITLRINIIPTIPMKN